MSTLYKDPLVKITDEEVVLHRYYFPFGGDKHVPLTALTGVQTRQPSYFGGSWQLWGTGDFRT